MNFQQWMGPCCEAEMLSLQRVLQELSANKRSLTYLSNHKNFSSSPLLILLYYLLIICLYYYIIILFAYFSMYLHEKDNSCVGHGIGEP